jgi:CRP/FNR family transcriptional regulator, cyclic AMP receptor protein
MATFNPQTFLTQVGNGTTTLTSPKKQVLFSQGDTTDAVLYVQAGRVKLTVVSPQGERSRHRDTGARQFFHGDDR